VNGRGDRKLVAVIVLEKGGVEEGSVFQITDVEPPRVDVAVWISSPFAVESSGVMVVVHPVVGGVPETKLPI
jgi:hypothetical protein